MNEKVVNYHPVILMVDNKGGNEYRELIRWLADSRFFTYQAEDLLDAVEEINDFTVQYFPDVILLEVSSIKKDYLAVLNFVRQSFPHADEIDVLAYSGSEFYPSAVSTLTQLKMKLDRAIPKANRPTSEIAAGQRG